MSSAEPFTFEIPFRPPYELLAAPAWFTAAIGLMAMHAFGWFPIAPMFAGAFVCFFFGFMRFSQGFPRWLAIRKLRGGKLEFITYKQLYKKFKKGGGKKIWIGRGFEWGQNECDMSYGVIKRGTETVIKTTQKGGWHWVHGLGKEVDLYVDRKDSTTHTIIPGTTGAGKTSMYRIIVTQAIFMGDAAVIVIDPKGDHDLQKNMREACEFMGDPSRYIFFSPAHQDESCCLDAMKNWNRQTELASRVAALIPSETGADPFTAFGWKMLNDVGMGLIATLERPNLMKLRRNIEGGVEQLLLRALRMHFASAMPENWETELSPYIARAKDDDQTVRGHIRFYREVVASIKPATSLTGLIGAFEHNREHAQKMIASLIPILSMLTTPPLDVLLSPEPDNAEGKLITDLAQIIRNNQVLYVGLDSLADAVVGSAIGSLLLSDLTAVAAHRYNYESKEYIESTPIFVLVDEASEVINEPTVKMLNKSRGSNVAMYLGTQTDGDIEERMGNRARFKQVMGNLNSMFAMKIKGAETVKYISEELPVVQIKTMSRSFSSRSDSRSIEGVVGGVSEQVEYEEGCIFPPTGLSKMPNLQYLGQVADGRVLKGRIPVLVKEAA